MNDFLEPVLFVESEKYLSGANKNLPNYEYINDVTLALKLFFEQNIPSGFAVWNDFWIKHTSYILNNPQYKDAFNEISKNLNKTTPNSQKKAIKERLIYLKMNKRGLVNSEYYNFKEKIKDDVYDILQTISIQRFIFEHKDSKLEEIFNLLKEGYFVCGVKNDSRLVLFNPNNLKSD